VPAEQLDLTISANKQARGQAYTRVCACRRD
jgi:hypothetical protein